MNLKAKAFFLVAVGVISSPLTAAECNFQDISGVDFQFDHIADYDRFSVRTSALSEPVYPDWFYHPNDRDFIEYDKFFRRDGKILNDSFLRKTETVEGFENKTQYVRYYEAIAENCERIWVRIPEDSKEFSRYFNVMDHKVDGTFPWNWEENTLNVRFSDQYQQLEAHVGKSVMTVPVTDRTILPAYPENTNELHGVPEFATFTLNAVKDNAFSVAGHLRSPYSLYVTDAEGNGWRIPWDPEYIRLDDPLKSLSLSTGVSINDIKTGNLVYGMSKDEVMLAWGVPHLERNHPILRESSTGIRRVVDENHLHDGLLKLPKDRTFPLSKATLEGHMTWWFYPDRLEQGQHLAFDRQGRLKQSVQTRRIYKQRIQPVEVAADRIR